VNHCTIELTISPCDPILIKSGKEGADPTKPDMEFVETYHQGGKVVSQTNVGKSVISAERLILYTTWKVITKENLNRRNHVPKSRKTENPRFPEALKTKHFIFLCS
jgi:hypothetical protein